MGVVGIVVCSVACVIFLYVAGVYLHDFISRRIASKKPPLSEGEQRSADYAAYKGKM